MKHLELTNEELREVAKFWGDWIRSGGEGEKPNAFQLEALNDLSFRDAFLFWQVGGILPERDMGGAFPRAKVAYDLLGPLPTDFHKAIMAQAATMSVLNMDIQVEDTDTGSVMVLAYAIWATLLGEYDDAIHTLNGILTANMRYAALKMKRDGDTSGIYHRDPLIAIAYAARVLGNLAKTDPLTASDKAREAYGVLDGSPAHAYILSETIAKMGERTQ